MRRRNPSDEGAVLVLVLVFVVVVGLLIGAVVDQIRASVGTTIVVRNQQALTFAADAGIEKGMHELRRDTRLCATPSAAVSVGSYMFNGRQVDVTCEAVAGGSNGILGYAVVTLDDTDDSLTTSGGGDKKIRGPVWTGQLDQSVSNLIVEDGDIVDHFHGPGNDSCALNGAAPSGLTVQPLGIFSYSCSPLAAPAFAPTLPTVVLPALPPINAGTCRTFFPGVYNASTWPGLASENYFVSGVYLFDDVLLDVSGPGGKKVVGGAQAVGEALLPGLTPCSNDSVSVTASGTGVKFLLGGTSRIRIASSNGNAMQLFARRGGSAAEGTQGLSVMQVMGSSTLPNSELAPSDDIITVASGSNPNFGAHGIVYTPSGRINVDNASAGSAAQFRGGIVTGRLHLQNSGSSTGLVVSIDLESTVRTVRLVARTKLDAGDKEIVATAVLDVSTDLDRTSVVDSWHSTN